MPSSCERRRQNLRNFDLPAPRAMRCQGAKVAPSKGAPRGSFCEAQGGERVCPWQGVGQGMGWAAPRLVSRTWPSLPTPWRIVRRSAQETHRPRPNGLNAESLSASKSRRLWRSLQTFMCIDKTRKPPRSVLARTRFPRGYCSSVVWSSLRSSLSIPVHRFGALALHCRPCGHRPHRAASVSSL